MQILTADVMEELMNFKKDSNIKFDIFIDNNVIYLRFHCGQMFEVKSFKDGIYDEKTINKYYNILNFTYSLSNKIINVIKELPI